MSRRKRGAEPPAEDRGRRTAEQRWVEEQRRAEEQRWAEEAPRSARARRRGDAEGWGEPPTAEPRGSEPRTQPGRSERRRSGSSARREQRPPADPPASGDQAYGRRGLDQGGYEQRGYDQRAYDAGSWDRPAPGAAAPSTEPPTGWGQPSAGEAGTGRGGQQPSPPGGRRRPPAPDYSQGWDQRQAQEQRIDWGTRPAAPEQSGHESSAGWERHRQAWEQQLPWSGSPSGADRVSPGERETSAGPPGNAGRHADTSAWPDEQPWEFETSTGDGRITPTTGPVTDSGWYATDDDPAGRTDWTSWTTTTGRAYDPLADPATTTHSGWFDDQAERPSPGGEEWTGQWERQGGPDPSRPDATEDRWQDPPGWGETTRTDMHGGLDALQSFPGDDETGRQPARGLDPGPGPQERTLPGADVPRGLAGLGPTSGPGTAGVAGSAEATAAAGAASGPGGASGTPLLPPPDPAVSTPRGDLAADSPAARTRPGAERYDQLRSSVLSRLRLTPGDLEVLRWWTLTRVAILLVVLTGPSLFLAEGKVPSFLDRWKQWDFWHFDRIATHGYFGTGWDTPVEAFFPGFPALLRIGTVVGVPTVLVGLIVSFVAGGVAAVALARLADAEWGEGAGRRAATMWMVAPPAIFLAAPYTESLFLGFAIPAWLAARRGHWWVAALLAAGASTVRVSGLFLAVALAVEFLTSPRRRDWLSGLWLLVPLVPLLGYMSYLKIHTGDWLRWYHAQADEWYRGFTLPHQAFLNTWNAATGRTPFGDVSEAVRANFEWMFRAELVALLVGIALTVALLWLRRWGEATWVGIQVLAFATSYWFFSVPRATLLWFPLWIGLAALSLRKQWVWLTYLLIAVPLFGVWAAAYANGKWSG